MVPLRARMIFFSFLQPMRQAQQSVHLLIAGWQIIHLSTAGLAKLFGPTACPTAGNGCASSSGSGTTSIPFILEHSALMATPSFQAQCGWVTETQREYLVKQAGRQAGRQVEFKV